MSRPCTCIPYADGGVGECECDITGPPGGYEVLGHPWRVVEVGGGYWRVIAPNGRTFIAKATEEA